MAQFVGDLGIGTFQIAKRFGLIQSATGRCRQMIEICLTDIKRFKAHSEIIDLNLIKAHCCCGCPEKIPELRLFLCSLDLRVTDYIDGCLRFQCRAEGQVKRCPAPTVDTVGQYNDRASRVAASELFARRQHDCGIEPSKHAWRHASQTDEEALW